MAIKEPRKFITTDQGHADVFNIPITTLYENDQELAAQLESIKTDPAGNDIASKAALDNHISDTNLHVTAAKQATWNAAEGNAKKYTEQYAAPKAHTHLASDLPSASTQARGIVQLNTSTSSTATDQAAAPIAVKAAYDLANAGQRIKVTDDSGRAQDISWQDLNINRPTGWYMGSNMGNAPSADWYWVEHIKHNDIWCIQKVYNFNNTNSHVRYMRNGIWSQWSSLGGGNMALVASNNVRISQTDTYAQQVSSIDSAVNVSSMMLLLKFVPRALGELRIYWEGLAEVVSGNAPNGNCNWAIIAEALGSNTLSDGEHAAQNTVFNYRDTIGTTKGISASTTISAVAKPGFNSWFGNEGTIRVTTPGPIYIAFHIYAAHYSSSGGTPYTFKGSVRNVQICYDEVTP